MAKVIGIDLGTTNSCVAVMFEPGGKHVMLFGLDPKVKPGGTVRLDLKLADGSTASVDAKAVGTADGPPAGHEHHH